MFIHPFGPHDARRGWFLRFSPVTYHNLLCSPSPSSVAFNPSRGTYSLTSKAWHSGIPWPNSANQRLNSRSLSSHFDNPIYTSDCRQSNTVTPSGDGGWGLLLRLHRIVFLESRRISRRSPRVDCVFHPPPPPLSVLLEQ